MDTLRIGTRGSPLALWQAHFVRDRLRQVWPDLNIELVEILTIGDQVRDRPLSQIGGDGLFTKAIQDALLERRADVAVHSLKDLPTTKIEGLMLAAVPPRGPVGDALVSNRHRSFADLPQGAKVASSSLRRRAQLLHRRPDLHLSDIRGNVDTRLRKLDELDLDAILLAEAGLVRLGLHQRITEVLDSSWILPAVGQGALGLECRTEDAATQKILQPLDDPTTHGTVLAERSLLRGLGGGCQVPIGAATSLAYGMLRLRGVVLPPDGSQRIYGENSGPVEQAEKLGTLLAEQLLANGAREILA